MLWKPPRGCLLVRIVNVSAVGDDGVVCRSLKLKLFFPSEFTVLKVCRWMRRRLGNTYADTDVVLPDTGLLPAAVKLTGGLMWKGGLHDRSCPQCRLSSCYTSR
jgi:hypothetical protein